MNIIHPTAIIDVNVKLGKNNHIGPFCYITGNTVIGDNNRFDGYCSIGANPEHRDYFTTSGQTSIGDNNIFREFVTIHSGTTRITTIGNHVVLLRNSYIAHDCIVEDKVNLSANALVGGYGYLMEGCNFGLGAVCHQFSVIGAYAMIGMGTVITKKSQILPGNTYIGNPAKLLKRNEIGLQKNQIDEHKLLELITRYHTLKK